MSKPVQISVLIPVFNRKHLVGEAINSALLQNVPGLEVIVVDNCSDDGTWEYLQTFEDERLRLHRNNSNLGLFGNFDRCAALARGELSLFLCSDDRLAPGFLQSAAARMRRDQNIVVLSSRGRIINERGEEGRLTGDRFPAGQYEGRTVVPAWFWTSYNYGANPLNYPSGIMLRTSSLQRCLPFRAELGAIADVDMYLRLLRLGDLYISNEVGCYVMRHEQQEGLVARRSGELMRNDMALLAEFRAELESFGVYRQVNRQIACLALACLVRIARVDARSALQLFRTLGRNPMLMLYAASRRVFFTALERTFGYRVIPYLATAKERAGHTV